MISQTQIQQVVQRIADNYRPDKIILFGSYAEGTANDDSDIDLLIIKETNVDLKQIMKKCTGIITEKGGLLSLTAIFSREFKIPCIVGVKNISKYVKPDDKLVFNLKTGTILKKE